MKAKRTVAGNNQGSDPLVISCKQNFRTRKFQNLQVVVVTCEERQLVYHENNFLRIIHLEVGRKKNVVPLCGNDMN